MFLKNRIDKVRNFDYSTSTVNVTKELSKNLIACEEYPYFVVLNQQALRNSCELLRRRSHLQSLQIFQCQIAKGDIH